MTGGTPIGYPIRERGGECRIQQGRPDDTLNLYEAEAGHIFRLEKW